MRASRETREYDATDAPPSAAPTVAQLLQSAGAVTSDSGHFIQELAATVQAEARLNVAVAGAVVRIWALELMGLILSWAVALVFVGYTVFWLSQNVYVALAGVAAMQAFVMIWLVVIRKRCEARSGFKRTRELLSGGD